MKKQKMYLGDMLDAGIDYIDFQCITEANKYSGYRYIIEKPLTEKQIAIINSYKNTIISYCYYRYAPEICYDTVILLDKCIKESEKVFYL